MTWSKSGLANLLIAIVLAALSAPIVKWLVVHGGTLGVSKPGAISFCNIFFVGNLCAGFVVLLSSGWRGIRDDLRASKAFTRILLIGAVLVGGVLAPFLLFYALEFTSVTNLLLLSRIESVAFAALAVVFFRDAVSRTNWVGLVAIALGSVALALLHGKGVPTLGDGFALLGGVMYAVGAIMAKFILRDLGMAAFLFIRNLVGAIVFFWIALLVYGRHHFTDAFAPELWMVMLVYGAGVVVLGQVTWFRALKTLPSAAVAVLFSLTPVVGIFFAYVLLAEVPDVTQWFGAGIIITGVAISQVLAGSGPWLLGRQSTCISVSASLVRCTSTPLGTSRSTLSRAWR